MRVKALFFARYREIAGESCDLELPEGSSVATARAELERIFPELSLMGAMAAVNSVYASPARILSKGDEVAFLPPVSGGSDTVALIQEAPIDSNKWHTWAARPNCGALVSFAGSPRDEGMGLEALFYEAYLPMAQRVLGEIISMATQHYPIERGVIVHRIGVVKPQEISVLIVLASPHRREALTALSETLEAIKSQTPIWKKECFAGGSRWVAGQSDPRFTLTKPDRR